MTCIGSATELPIEVRPLQADDVTAAIALLDQALGGWPIIEGVDAEWDRNRFFDWKHRQSPFGPSHLIVAARKGEVVGVRAFMPWRLAAGAHDVQALRSADAATKPELQRSGVFAQLRTQADQLLPPGAHIGFGTPNSKSFRATAKLGRGKLIEVVRPWVRLALRRTASAMASRRHAGSVDAPRAAEVLARNGTLTALLEEIRAGETRLTTPRSLEYLRWRFGDAPLGYHAVCDETAREVRGIALFRVRAARGLPQAVVEELLVRPGDRRTAMRLLRTVASAAQAPLVSCRFPTPSAQRVAAVTAGFLPRREGLPLVATRLTPDAPDISRPEHWALTLGDVEIF